MSKIRRECLTNLKGLMDTGHREAKTKGAYGHSLKNCAHSVGTCTGQALALGTLPKAHDLLDNPSKVPWKL